MQEPKSTIYAYVVAENQKDVQIASSLMNVLQIVLN